MSRPIDPYEAFTDKYQKFMVRVLDRFEFFGVDPRGIVRRHSFADGYVPLALSPRDPCDGTVSAGLYANQVLRNHRLAVVRGIAGSGKSTLLRWVGVEAAGRVDEQAVAPFLLELGRYADGQLPDLHETVPRPLSKEMPDGWVDHVLAQGRVLLMLDGLDEVSPRQRAKVEEWVEGQLATHPDIRCIVATRPSVVAEQWWVDHDFVRFDLLQMSRYSIELYVHGWHELARADLPDTPEGEDARLSLILCEKQMLATLYNRPALRGMSSNPLLCGLLCALNLIRGEHLPESRKEIYDAALDLFLSRWPVLRRRPVTHIEPADIRPDTGRDVQLRTEELVKLLQRLAFWLVTNRESVLRPDVARDRLASFMRGLRSSDEDPDRVLHYVAHTSGLLRELPDRSLQFIHRTFRDHLAAKEVIEENNIGLLLDSADKPHWHDVVVMAGAHARPAERTQILVTLLKRGQGDSRHRDALYLLAAAVLEQAAVLPQDPRSPDVRAMVTKAMAELIPPRTTAAADQLAATGEFVLDLMPGPEGLTDRQAAMVVRAAARIAALRNPPGAVEKILQFTTSRASGVLNEVLKPWGRLGDYEEYARDVLSEIDFSRLNVDLQNMRRIEHIGHLRTITSLVLNNDLPDLSPLADLPRLRRLTLRGNTLTALKSLADARSLRVLVLDGCSTMADARPVDLSPLKGLALDRLVIGGLTTKVDIASLPPLRLHSMHLSGGALRGAPSLPAGLHVPHLSLHGGARRVGLAGLTGVRTIILGWAPDDGEVAMLRKLTELCLLVLWKVSRGTAIPALPGVRVVIVYAN